MAESYKARRLGWLWGIGATAALLTMAVVGVGWYVIHNVPSLMSDRRLIERQSEAGSLWFSPSLDPPLSWVFGKQSVGDEIDARIAEGRGDALLMHALEIGVDQAVYTPLSALIKKRPLRLDEFERIVDRQLNESLRIVFLNFNRVERSDARRLNQVLIKCLEIDDQFTPRSASYRIVEGIRKLEQRNRSRAGLEAEYIALIEANLDLQIEHVSATAGAWKAWGERAIHLYDRLLVIDEQRIAEGAPEEVRAETPMPSAGSIFRNLFRWGEPSN